MVRSPWVCDARRPDASYTNNVGSNVPTCTLEGRPDAFNAVTTRRLSGLVLVMVRVTPSKRLRDTRPFTVVVSVCVTTLNGLFGSASVTLRAFARVIITPAGVRIVVVAASGAENPKRGFGANATVVTVPSGVVVTVEPSPRLSDMVSVASGDRTRRICVPFEPCSVM